jgi:hypothetical protein
MRMSSAFPSNYLRAADLQGRNVTVTIDRVAMEDIGGDHKPVLYFRGKEKGMVLNKTNGNNISAAYGDETDDWADGERSRRRYSVLRTAMQDAAVISGSLVDAKNVNTHKVMRLIIDVPAENALKVIAAFGWPTMVNPVSVAVARLNDETNDARQERQTETRGGTGRDTARLRDGNDDPDTHVAAAGADKPKKSPAQIAGYLCTTM